MALEKWFNTIGCVVDVIYISKKGVFTKRRIRVLSVRDGYIRAFCLDSGAQRVFLSANVLAAELVNRDVS
ncbi:hypothetical protein [Candidatus Pristimantibacillus sp. PTI5]|uniref:hypothetical protein n=1 Tax=Candidatus Pristimantibacillus sp. PTI5 TaxID=3400422 RepID=UPI003B019811